MSSNLPPGVTEGMIPGNTPEDEAMDHCLDWATDQLVELSVSDVYRAVKIGIAAVKAEQADIDEMVKFARQDERFCVEAEESSKPNELDD